MGHPVVSTVRVRMMHFVTLLLVNANVKMDMLVKLVQSDAQKVTMVSTFNLNIDSTKCSINCYF